MADLILSEAQRSNFQRNVRAIAAEGGLGQHVPLHLTPPVVVSEQPSGGAGKIETSLVSPTFAQTTIVRVPQSVTQYKGGYIQLNLAASTTSRAYPGLNAIKSIRCTYSGQQLWYIQDYPAALKIALKLLSMAQAEAMLIALGGAAPGTAAVNLCIPLLDPWGPYVSRNGGDGINLSKLSRGSQLTYEIQFNIASSTTTGTGVISSGVMTSFYEQNSSSVDAADSSSLLFMGRQLLTGAIYVPAGAQTAFAFNVRDFVGSSDLLALWFLSSSASFLTTGINDYATTDLSCSSVNIDGRQYWNSTSPGASASHAIEGVAWGQGRADAELAAANSESVVFIPFTSSVTSANVHTFGLNTANINTLTCSLTHSTPALAIVPVALTSLLITVDANGSPVVFTA